jgi:hypothetical protein
MKIVKENINFERGVDPKSYLKIGLKSQIENWLNQMNIKNYKILEDFTIDVLEPISLIGMNIKEFPSFIQFNKAYNSFDIDDCGLISLRGCPKTITGYFSCQGNKLMSLKYSPLFVGDSYYCTMNPGNFTEEDVRKVCKVHKNIQADDTPEK